MTFARLHELSKTKTSFCFSRSAKLTSVFLYLFPFSLSTEVLQTILLLESLLLRAPLSQATISLNSENNPLRWQVYWILRKFRIILMLLYTGFIIQCTKALTSQERPKRLLGSSKIWCLFWHLQPSMLYYYNFITREEEFSLKPFRIKWRMKNQRQQFKKKCI